VVPPSFIETTKNLNLSGQSLRSACYLITETNRRVLLLPFQQFLPAASGSFSQAISIRLAPSAYSLSAVDTATRPCNALHDLVVCFLCNLYHIFLSSVNPLQSKKALPHLFLLPPTQEKQGEAHTACWKMSLAFADMSVYSLREISF
jgi:hypothetical protein